MRELQNYSSELICWGPEKSSSRLLVPNAESNAEDDNDNDDGDFEENEEEEEEEKGRRHLPPMLSPFREDGWVLPPCYIPLDSH